MLVLPGMDAIAKYVGDAGTMSPGQLTFWRFAVQAMCFAAWIAWIGRGSLKGGFSGRNSWVNFLRGVLLGSASLLFFVAVKYMPLADAIALFFVEPLILTALAAIILRETVGWRRIAAIFVGFMGAMIVVQPSYAVFGPVSLLPLGTATLFAFYMLLNRVVGRRDSVAQMQFMSGVGGAVTLAFALMLGAWFGITDLDYVTQTPPAHWMLVVLMCCIGLFGHMLIVLCLKSVPSSVLAPFQYVEIIAAALLGWIVFGDVPSASKWLGMAIIVGSGLYVFYRESRGKRSP